MIKLPDKCLVDKYISIEEFYKRIVNSSNDKDGILKKVRSIKWLYKLSYETFGIPKTKDVEEIQIIEINLNIAKVPKGIINEINKAIPYNILFVVRHSNDFCYAVKYEDLLYYTSWNIDIKLNFNGKNLEEIYENISKTIMRNNTSKVMIRENDVYNDLKKILPEGELNKVSDEIKMTEEQIDDYEKMSQELEYLFEEIERQQKIIKDLIDDQRKKLEKEILNTKMNLYKEKQFNRKVELNRKLRILEGRLKYINDDFMRKDI